MCSKTGEMNVSDDHPYAVVAEIDCKSILVRENTPSSPTTDFDVYDPDTNSLPFRAAQGESYIFESSPSTYYRAGTTVGYIQAVSGTVTFGKVHQQ